MLTKVSLPIQHQQCIMVQYIYTKVGCETIISKKICVTAPLQLATLFGSTIDQLDFFQSIVCFLPNLEIFSSYLYALLNAHFLYLLIIHKKKNQHFVD